MSSDSNSSNSSFDQRLHEAAERAEQELHRFAKYLDDKVIPEVRRNGSTALRAAAVHLQKLADTMDDAKSGAENRATGPNQNTPGSS